MGATLLLAVMLGGLLWAALAWAAPAASGNVTYNFCSELGWSPCTPAQVPLLTVWYRP